MTKVHLYPFCREADTAFKDFIREEQVDRARKMGCGGVAIIENDEHVFIGQVSYDKWAMGRTYMMDGVMYHSGIRMQSGKE